MGILWSYLLNNLNHDPPPPTETIVETDATTNFVCECCSTVAPNEFDYIGNDNNNSFYRQQAANSRWY
jgi:hypothetical protein